MLRPQTGSTIAPPRTLPANTAASAVAPAGSSMSRVSWVGTIDTWAHPDSARTAASATGAMAGSDRVYDALFEQYGVIRAQTFSDLLDISGTLAAGRRLGGKRLAVLTSTGGAGVLVADACGALGFEAPPPDRPTVERLTSVLVGDEAMAERNPVDVTLAGLSSDIFRSAISSLLASPSYDALVVIVGSSGLARPELAGGPVLDAHRLVVPMGLQERGPGLGPRSRMFSDQNPVTLDAPPEMTRLTRCSGERSLLRDWDGGRRSWRPATRLGLHRRVRDRCRSRRPPPREWRRRAPVAGPGRRAGHRW